MALLTIIPSIGDGTSFYRAAAPMGDFSRKTGVSLVFESKVSWHTMELVDNVFMQRPFNLTHLANARLAKEYNKKIWIDHDDFLLGVTSDNPYHWIYNDPEIRSSIVQILEMADLVTVTTEALKTEYSKFNKNIHVVPNAFHKARLNEPLTYGKNNTVLWRGSQTHHRDLIEYKDEIIEVAHANPEWEWVFFGFDPWYISEKMPKNKVTFANQMDLFDYFYALRQISPKIAIVPLHDTTFNRCKSNIAAIESIYAGAVPLCPGWAGWEIPGVVHYQDKAGFKQLLNAMINDQSGGSMDYPLLADAISNSLSLDEVNKKRIELYKEFIA